MPGLRRRGLDLQSTVLKTQAAEIQRRGVVPFGHALYLLCVLAKSLNLSEPLEDGY